MVGFYILVGSGIWLIWAQMQIWLDWAGDLAWLEMMSCWIIGWVGHVVMEVWLNLAGMDWRLDWLEWIGDLIGLEI